jgi:plasmid recombination enzyme
MESNQFTHLQTYPVERSKISSGKGESWTVSDIVGEANREEKYCSHVDNPQPPIHLSGCHIDGLPQELEQYLENNKTPVLGKNGKVSYRKIRQDAHVLLTGIYSHPVPVGEHDEQVINDFFRDCLKFHRRRFGSVDCAVLHMDEVYPHIHVYTFSNRAKGLHPGFYAKSQAKKNGESNSNQRLAYKRAMIAFQDDYYESVSRQHGLQRLGPKRERLAPSIYKSEKSKLKALQASIKFYEEEERKKQEKRKVFDKKMMLLQEEYRAMNESFVSDEIYYFENNESFSLVLSELQMEIAALKTQRDEVKGSIGSELDLKLEIIGLRAELEETNVLLSKYEAAEENNSFSV